MRKEACVGIRSTGMLWHCQYNSQVFGALDVNGLGRIGIGREFILGRVVLSGEVTWGCVSTILGHFIRSLNYTIL